MRSLFLKIFLSYWVALALFFVLAIIVTITLRQRGEFAAWEARQNAVLSEAVQTYEQAGQPELRRYLDDLHDSQHVRAFLFDDHGQELSSRPVPHWAESVARGAMPPPHDLWQRFAPSPFRRITLAASSGRHYTAVVMLPPGPIGPGGIPGMGVFIGIVSSGLVCYLLARYLTSPIVRLRAATQKLAAGDLSARAGKPGSRGGDEIAELVRDFDVMAERLETSVKAQARLLTDISHELRSPLARLNVALALARQRTGPGAESALDRIDLEANRLNDLIGELLTIARLEAGDDSRQKLPIHMAEMLQEICSDADFEAQSRNCSVNGVIGCDPVVIGSPTLLHSAIENVVRNGTRYTREGTAVEVCLERADTTIQHEAIIRVADSGPGVPEESLSKIFRPFYRIDDARGRQTGGVGLGLAITDRVVRLHGGTVHAENRSEGGLVVEIRLPATPAQPDIAGLKEAAPEIEEHAT
ncbi:MAG: two-component sensor histidine kinase [Acidobacteria bacterium]|nr:MAG: two-component sensor histidine kinase [Acidobacteriota bacterium]